MASVLVIDDDAPLLDTLSEQLSTILGHDVVAVSSGKAALEHLQDHECDIVFSDIVMPDMNGLEVARAIDALRPGLPVILMTAFLGRHELAFEALRTNEAVIAKPVTTAMLGPLIRKVLGADAK